MTIQVVIIVVVVADNRIFEARTFKNEIKLIVKADYLYYINF